MAKCEGSITDTKSFGNLKTKACNFCLLFQLEIMSMRKILRLLKLNIQVAMVVPEFLKTLIESFQVIQRYFQVSGRGTILFCKRSHLLSELLILPLQNGQLLLHCEHVSEKVVTLLHG